MKTILINFTIKEICLQNLKVAHPTPGFCGKVLTLPLCTNPGNELMCLTFPHIDWFKFIHPASHCLQSGELCNNARRQLFIEEEHFLVSYFVFYISSYPFMRILKWLVMKALFLMSVFLSMLLMIEDGRMLCCQKCLFNSWRIKLVAKTHCPMYAPAKPQRKKSTLHILCSWYWHIAYTDIIRLTVQKKVLAKMEYSLYAFIIISDF